MQETKPYNCDLFVCDDFKTVYMLIKLHQTFSDHSLESEFDSAHVEVLDAFCISAVFQSTSVCASVV